MDNCTLCKINPQCEESHIIPRFIYRWVKRTSVTGYLRSSKNPNLRVQDGTKYKLLCEECEDLFGAFETSFSTQLFHPFVNAEQKPKFQHYDSTFMKFCISVLWRSLHDLWLSSEAQTETLQPELVGKLEAPYETWGRFLLGEIDTPKEFVVNVIPLDLVDSTSIPISDSSNINRYYARAVGKDLICTRTTGHVYVKIPYYIIVGTIFNKGKPLFSKNTQVKLKNGTLGGHMKIDANFMKYVFSRSQLGNSINDRLSDKQQQLIERSISSASKRLTPTDFIKTESVKAFLSDHNLKRSR